MPDAQDFNRLLVLVYIVIDLISIPQHFAHSRSRRDDLTDKRALSDLDSTIQQFIANSEGRFRVRPLNQAFNDFLKVSEEVLT